MEYVLEQIVKYLFDVGEKSSRMKKNYSQHITKVHLKKWTPVSTDIP